jgi:hypothetical protein
VFADGEQPQGLPPRSKKLRAIAACHPNKMTHKVSRDGCEEMSWDIQTRSAGRAGDGERKTASRGRWMRYSAVGCQTGKQKAEIALCAKTTRMGKQGW